MSSIFDKIKAMKTAKEQEVEKENVETKPPHIGNEEISPSSKYNVGDVVTKDAFQFTYIEFPIETCGRDYDTIFHGYNYGWEIKCIDTTTPMENVVMPDEIDGVPVISAKNCFSGCYNVATVAHIPEGCLHSTRGSVSDMFANSGLRELPEQLKGNYHCKLSACSKAFAMQEFESIIHPHEIEEIQQLQERKAGAEEYKGRVSMIDDEFSPYKQAGKVNFVYNFQPMTVYRVQTQDGKWRAIDFDSLIEDNTSTVCRVKFDGREADNDYEYFMGQLKGEKIYGLTADSFEEISLTTMKEVWLEKCDTIIDFCDKEIGKRTAIFDIIAEETAKANAAQGSIQVVDKPKINFAELIQNGDIR